MTRPSWLNSGEPEEPGSVVPRSQSSIRMWVPLPGTSFCRYEVVVVGSFSKLMRLAWPRGWWTVSDIGASIDRASHPTQWTL